MKEKILTTAVILFFAMSQGFSQKIELDFKKLSSDTAWIYSFRGSRVDSFSVILDKKGRAQADFPVKGYRGMAYFYIPQHGGSEFILAEKTLRIASPDEYFDAMAMEFPQSEENVFLRNAFQHNSFLAARGEWLTHGEGYTANEMEAQDFNQNNSRFAELFVELQKEQNRAVANFRASVKNSPLYAARYMELVTFMQRLYDAVQSPWNIAGQQTVINEMQYTLDINALYHSGNLWTDVHTYYPGLFFGANSDSVQQAYAASISTAMMRLTEPVLTAFLSGALTVCERTDWKKAQETLLRNFVLNYPHLPVSDPKIKRMLGALALNRGSKAPALTGLTEPVQQPAILVFVESNCDHCRRELEYLNKHYNKLTEKGYRIVSLAADTDTAKYQSIAAGFAWKEADRLCDYKGFDGENFKNYGIVGTPVIFVTDSEGKIAGRYASIAQAMEELF